MVDYLARSAWGARAPKGGPGLLTVNRVKGTVIHWPGTTSSKPITSAAAVASALRGWQAFHMDDREWSDIAYQVAVDQAGRAWTLRGLRTQSGANGNAELNEDYCAILLVLVQGEKPSAAMKATVRAVIADVRRIYPNGDEIRPHSKVRPDGTDCPGPAALAALEAGEFTPGHTTQEELTMGAREDILAYQKACAIQIQNNTRQLVAAAARQILAAVNATDADVEALDAELDKRDADMKAAIEKIPTGVIEP